MIRNKSVTYLLPLFCKYFVSKNIELREAIFVSYLENCYLYLKNKEDIYEGFIISLNKPKESGINFEYFVENLKNNDIFVNYYEEENKIIFQYKIPDSIQKTYQKFIEGKYSEIDEKHKKIILEFAKRNVSIDTSIRIMRVLSKSPELKKELELKLGMELSSKIELSSKPDITKETLIIT